MNPDPYDAIVQDALGSAVKTIPLRGNTEDPYAAIADSALGPPPALSEPSNLQKGYEAQASGGEFGTAAPEYYGAQPGGWDQLFKSVVPIPRIPVEKVPNWPTPGGPLPGMWSLPYNAAMANVGLGLLDFGLSPAGLLLASTGAGMPALLKRLIAGGFAADAARQVPEAAQQAGTMSVKGTPQQRAEANVGLISDIGMAGLLGGEALGPKRLGMPPETKVPDPYENIVQEAMKGGEKPNGEKEVQQKGIVQGEDAQQQEVLLNPEVPSTEIAPVGQVQPGAELAKSEVAGVPTTPPLTFDQLMQRPGPISAAEVEQLHQQSQVPEVKAELPLPEPKLSIQEQQAEAKALREAQRGRPDVPIVPEQPQPGAPLPVPPGVSLSHPVQPQPTKDETYDKESTGGIQGSLPQGEIPQQDVTEQGRSGQETPAGGVLQAPYNGPEVKGKDVSLVPPEDISSSKTPEATQFRHDFKNFAQVLSANKQLSKITDKEAVRFKTRANDLWDRTSNEKMSVEKAKQGLVDLREDMDNAVLLKEELSVGEDVETVEEPVQVSEPVSAPEVKPSEVAPIVEPLKEEPPTAFGPNQNLIPTPSTPQPSAATPPPPAKPPVPPVISTPPSSPANPPNPLNQPSQNIGPALLNQTLKGKLQGTYNKLRGYSAPRHAVAGPEVADKLVRYASSRIAAPEVSKWMATDVLGEHYKDPKFDELLGATLVEDRLRAIKKGFEDLAAKATDPVQQAEFLDKASYVNTLVQQPYSPFKTEADFQAALSNPEIKAAIDRHIKSIQPMAEQMHTALGGEKARPGEGTEAFVNLVAMLKPDDVEGAKAMIFGSKKGNLTNPRLRQSVFSKQALGTASRYDTSYRALAERMVRGNYEQYALKNYYDALVAKGLAAEARPGAEPPTLPDGTKMERIEIKPGRAFIGGKNLWVRPDLAPELRRALDVDKVENLGLKALTDIATNIQVVGPTDLAWHTVNMLAVLAGSQGTKSVFTDLVRKSISPVGFVDGMVRMGYNSLQALMDTPEAQKMVADYSKIGAGRARPVHQGGLFSTPISKVTGIPLERTQRWDPTHYLNKATGSLLKVLDTGGRLAANKMFDNLVERKMVKDTELDRREFINRMGQYNSRLMPQWDAILRENSLSSFIVAGKNMNRQAMRRVLMSPGFKAANPQAFAKAHIVEALSLASLVWAFPVAMNLAITGKPFGRPGLPVGAVDLGTNDESGKPKYFDPIQLILLRRGLRMTGAEALMRGEREKLGVSKTGREVWNDVSAAFIHPWAGPSVRTASTLFTGKDFPSGYLQSRNPMDLSENIIAAAKNSNPTVAAYFKDADEGGKGGLIAPAFSSVEKALGFKTGRNPTHLQQLDTEVQKRGAADYESASLAQKRGAQQALEATRQPKGVLSERSGAEKSLWENFARQDAVHDSLPSHQQKWLSQNKLTVPGFETELTLFKVQMPGTEEDKQFMLQAVSDQYQRTIQGWMNKPIPPSQAQFDKSLDYARARARVALRHKMSGVPASR